MLLRTKLFSRLLCALAFTTICVWITEKMTTDPMINSKYKFHLLNEQLDSKNICSLAFDGQTENENSLLFKEKCCHQLYRGDQKAIGTAAQIHVPPNDTAILNRLNSCDQFFDYYPSYMRRMHDFEDDENGDFSIAYSILAHRDLSHVERLLRLIYRPQHVYCIHIDKKSIGLDKKIRKLARCLPNVQVASRSYTVVWGGNGILRATLTCLKDLVTANKKWSYFINLSAQDLPLKTNAQLVRILRSWKNKSMIEISGPASKKKIDYRYEVKYNRFGNADSVFKSDTKKGNPPFNATIMKGNLAVILSRSLAEWFISDRKAIKLLGYLSDTANPDEYFWQTAVSNKEQFGLNREISQLIDSYYVRYSLWKGEDKKKCQGKFIRDVCIFGVADIRRLINLRKYLFVNKLYLGYQTPAYECMSLRYMMQSDLDDKL